MENNEKILSVKDLKISFKTDEGLVHAVRGVTFDLYKGETLCIVGESGSGKSVTSKTIMGILPGSAVIEGGSVIYQGEDLTKVAESEFHRIRGHQIGMIFQDPLSALNPIKKVGKQITEAMLIESDHRKRLFKDLTSKEQAAYNNRIVQKNTEILAAKNTILSSDSDYDDKIRELQLANDSMKKEGTEAYRDKVRNIDQQIFRLQDDLANTSDKAEKAEIREKISSLNAQRAALMAESNTIAKDLIADNNKKIKELNAEKKKKHAELKKASTKKIAEANKKYHEEIKPLREALKVKKKEAKEEVSKFLADIADTYKAEKDKINNEYEVKLTEAKNKVTELQNSYSDAPSKSIAKMELDEAKTNYRNLVKEKNAALSFAHSNYVSKLRITRAEAKERALKVMKEVGIPQPEIRFNQYPFQFSGGMRQRIVIAIALIASPEILICDEPTTALDVTIQAQILELINRIKKERNMSVIFITHDLGVVANMADRVAVMYAGKIVEVGKVDEIFYDPRHPYTWALLSSIPDLDSKESLESIPGTPPYLLNPPKGDAFASRNKYALAIDFKEQPPFFKVTDTHYAATWLLDKRAPKIVPPKIVTTRIKNSLQKAGIKYEEK